MMVYKVLSGRMAYMFISTALTILGIVDKCTATPFESRINEHDGSSQCDVKNDYEDNSNEDNCFLEYVMYRRKSSGGFVGMTDNTDIWLYFLKEIATSCQCGVVNKSKIIGGTEVNPMRKYPWHVGLYLEGYYFVCGGTIINDRWILTAAHCIILDDKTCDKLKYNSSRPLRVVVGEHNQLITSDDDTNTKEYNVKRYVKHPKYNCSNVNYDFALLELTEPIPFNNIIRPVCLPKDDNESYANQTGIVIGWGRTGDKEMPSSFLREIQVPILGNDECKGWGTLAPMKMCYDIVLDKAACRGDSGGPVHVIQNNKYVQVGVVSYGHMSSCINKEYPKVSARVSKVLQWIATTTENGTKCT